MLIVVNELIDFILATLGGGGLLSPQRSDHFGQIFDCKTAGLRSKDTRLESLYHNRSNFGGDGGWHKNQRHLVWLLRVPSYDIRSMQWDTKFSSIH